MAANVGPNTALPVDGIIQIGFDRYLNPATVNRQSVALRDLFGGAPQSPIIQYDPVARVVTLSSPNPGQVWLQTGVSYEVVFPIATPEAGSFGLRAVDGATLDPATFTLIFPVVSATGTTVAPPPIDFCNDVFPLFSAQHQSAPQFGGSCSYTSCHGSAGNNFQSAMGLLLDSPTGIRHTAIGIQAVETANAALPTPLPPQNAFPLGMPIIDPGNPGNSYIVYKLLLPSAVDGNVPDASGTSVPYTPGCSASITKPFDYGPTSGFASAEEAARLAGLVTGRRMPWGSFDDGDGGIGLHGTALTFDEIERIRLWIAQGAAVDDCTCLATMP